MPTGLSAPRECRSCRRTKPHHSRGLCNACYKRHSSALSLAQFPPVRETVSARARYDGWVASGLTCKEYARLVGIWETSLARSLRVERDRRRRRGLPWLDGYRREQS